MKSLAFKIFSFFYHWRTLYVIVLITLIQMYPVAVSDGQQLLYAIKETISPKKTFEIEGIDISHHNAQVDWKRLTDKEKNPKKIHFCFIKATEGGDFVDHFFQENWQQAQKVNIPKGAYHFYRPTTNPRLQAQNFIKNVRLEKGDYAPVLDLEIQSRNRKAQRNLTSNVKQWLQIIEKHYGIKPIIYTNRFMYETYIKGKLDEYPLWVSQYETDKLEGFEGAKVLFWQHSQTGKTHGIKGDVDFNAFLGSYLDLFSIKIGEKHLAKNYTSQAK